MIILCSPGQTFKRLMTDPLASTSIVTPLAHYFGSFVVMKKRCWTMSLSMRSLR